MFIEVTREMIKLADEVSAEDQSNLAMWNAIIAFVSATFIIPLIQQPKWRQKTRAAVTFFYSLLLGLGTAWISGDLDLTNVVKSVLTVFTVAIVTYHGFSGPTGIAPAIENATSSGRQQPLDDPPA